MYLKIGVLALQGAIEEHIHILKTAGKKIDVDVEVVRVINPIDLDDLDGLIMPGGESTSMTLIGGKTGMLDAVLAKIVDLPTFGTCAGAILLSKKTKRNENTDVQDGVFPLLNAQILRNGYGRQRDSFSTNLSIKSFDDPFEGIFIRAPKFESINGSIEVLASVRDNPVLIRQENILAATFHPELTNDTRIHEYFLKMVLEKKKSEANS